LTNALVLRAKIYLVEDQPRAAIPLLEKVVSLEPDDVRGRQSLMLAYRLVKDDRRAEEQERQRRALQRDNEQLARLQQRAATRPWDAGARYQLAVLYSKSSRPQALGWIQAALACSPNNRRIRQVWTQLAGYQPPEGLRVP
jgi:tetratricopeptide (TPR) repeat protein